LQYGVASGAHYCSGGYTKHGTTAMYLLLLTLSGEPQRRQAGRDPSAPSKRTTTTAYLPHMMLMRDLRALAEFLVCTSDEKFGIIWPKINTRAVSRSRPTVRV